MAKYQSDETLKLELLKVGKASSLPCSKKMAPQTPATTTFFTSCATTNSCCRLLCLIGEVRQQEACGWVRCLLCCAVLCCAVLSHLCAIHMRRSRVPTWLRVLVGKRDTAASVAVAVASAAAFLLLLLVLLPALLLLLSLPLLLSKGACTVGAWK